MNGRKAKALRKALGFHPSAEREYSVQKTPLWNLFTGHVTNTGKRSTYQKIKRTPGLINAVLSAAKKAVLA